MSTALELVYHYRQLAGKCEVSGLSMDEIHAMSAIESEFAERGDDNPHNQFARERGRLTATLRGRKAEDTVHVDNLAPGGLVCINAPYFDENQTVEVVIDDTERGLSYRFKAQVTWIDDDDDDDYMVGLRFVGAPVLLRYGANTTPVPLARAA